MEIVLLIIGLIVGSVSAWLIAKYKFKSQMGFSKEEAEEAEKRINELKAELGKFEELLKDEKERSKSLSEESENKHKQIVDISSQLAKKEQRVIGLEEKLEEQKGELEELYNRFKTEFENLSNKIFEDKSEKFTELNRDNIENILKPLGEKIKDFETKVEETYDKEARQRASLSGEIKQLVELNQKISQEANNLTKALKGQSKTRGDWGEVILENILEKSGLEKDREYFLQKSYTVDSKRFQPDAVVAFPDDRNVIIDSKVSLVAYEKYSSAETEEEAEKALKEHINSIKNHINGLSSKSYWNIPELDSLDFVIMFVPIEPAYFAAIKAEPNLWMEAYEKKILLINPTNLLAVLKMAENLWRRERQNRNALEIAERSGKLYDKFVGFYEDMQGLGDKLDKSVETYNDAMKKLKDGRGNLVGRVEKIKTLGAKTKKSLPNDVIARLDDED